jgi:hypothetical protein
MPALLRRKVAAITAPPDNTPQRVPIPLGATLQTIVLRLTGTLTVGTAAATVLPDSPLGYLKQVDLILGGSFPLRSLDGRALFLRNTLQRFTAPRRSAPSGSVGSSNFLAEVYLDLWQPDLLPPLARAFWLDTRFLSRVDLVVNVGEARDIATPGGSGTVTISNVNIDVIVEEVPDAGGLLSRMQELRAVVRQVTATGRLALDPFAGAGVTYRGFLVNARSGNADPNRGTDDDTIISAVALRDSRGRRWVDDQPWETLRSQTKTTYALETMPNGWALVDFAPSQTLEDLLVTRGLQNVQMELVIGAAPANAWVQVYPLVAILRSGR